MGKSLSDMTPDELRAELFRLRDALGDSEATFNFNLAHANQHLPDGMIFEHEAEIEELRAKIAEIEGMLRG